MAHTCGELVPAQRVRLRSARRVEELGAVIHVELRVIFGDEGAVPVYGAAVRVIDPDTIIVVVRGRIVWKAESVIVIHTKPSGISNQPVVLPRAPEGA